MARRLSVCGLAMCVSEPHSRAKSTDAGLMFSVRSAAAFFLSQFATALLWASAATRYGRRTVLFVSLLGNTLMLLAYGTCKSVYLMVVIRLLQGCFNGAVGVARGAVKDITDSTNEGQAYSVLGVCWSLGGILGPVIGVSPEWPSLHLLQTAMRAY